VRGERAVRGGVLVTTFGSQLHESLDPEAQGFELLSDNAFRRTSIQILYQKLHTAVLRESEGV